ncbi:MAG: cupredoxin domain-containing protein [Proteobacteria bacterium]|nr:cupredoxin domain-containing protein [Pseudomonadota bacterium]
MSRLPRLVRLVLATGACVPIAASPYVSAQAADAVEIAVSIKDHKFEPAQIKVAAGKAIKLTVNNLDATPEEFESKALSIEKVVAGKGLAVVRIRPLAKGTYNFVGEYHEDTAKGTLDAE